MQRAIETHKTNGCNSAITITAVDEPGPGGANHQYSIRWKNERDQTEPLCFIGFQNGPTPEVGTNGVTHESLLAVLIDRLEGFQRGPFACQENQAALNLLREALSRLHKRTEERVARGVEGTLKV